MRALLPVLLCALLAASAQAQPPAVPASPAIPATPVNPASELLAAAKAQIGVTLRYDPRYRRIAYPGGDVPEISGMSSDVVIRAYRKLGVDLQQLVIEDMQQAGGAYPRGRRKKGVDRSFDHRRVQNLATWFKRHATVLPTAKDKTNYLPGDIVTFRLPGSGPHIAIVSDKKSQTSVPLVVHNLRAGVREDNALFSFPITGHYRWTPAAK